MEDKYVFQARKNILPLSLADNLPEAFKEWSFTEIVYDHVTPKADCELCNRERLRYHFEIKNDFTGEKLWVGSSCILRFGLSVYDDGEVLSNKKAKQKLDALTRKMQLDSCIKSLEILVQKENDQILWNALEYYKREKKLTPKYAAVVFWRMQENKVDYQAGFFKIALRKHQHKCDLKQLKTYQVHGFWKALTSPQRKIAQAMGHPPPTS